MWKKLHFFYGREKKMLGSVSFGPDCLESTILKIKGKTSLSSQLELVISDFSSFFEIFTSSHYFRNFKNDKKKFKSLYNKNVIFFFENEITLFSTF